MAESAVASGDGERKYLSYDGPKPGVKYPLQVVYVDVCDGWPIEYCEHHPNHEKAKTWMEENLTEDMKEMYLNEEKDDDEGSEEAKKRQKRGGRGVIKTKKKESSKKEQSIKVSRASRGKRKFVTVITGLGTFEIDLKVASKYFGQRFACGASVTGDDEIVIQGDVKDDLFDVIPQKWKQIDEDLIEDLGDMKR